MNLTSQSTTERLILNCEKHDILRPQLVHGPHCRVIAHVHSILYNSLTCCPRARSALIGLLAVRHSPRPMRLLLFGCRLCCWRWCSGRSLRWFFRRVCLFCGAADNVEEAVTLLALIQVNFNSLPRNVVFG